MQTPDESVKAKGRYGFTFEFKLRGNVVLMIRYQEGDRDTASVHRIHLFKTDKEENAKFALRSVQSFAGCNAQVEKALLSLIDSPTTNSQKM